MSYVTDEQIARAARALVKVARRHRKTWTGPEGEKLLALVDKQIAEAKELRGTKQRCPQCGIKLTPEMVSGFCTGGCAAVYAKTQRDKGLSR